MKTKFHVKLYGARHIVSEKAQTCCKCGLLQDCCRSVSPHALVSFSSEICSFMNLLARAAKINMNKTINNKKDLILKIKTKLLLALNLQKVAVVLYETD